MSSERPVRETGLFITIAPKSRSNACSKLNKGHNSSRRGGWEKGTGEMDPRRLTSVANF